MRDLKFTGRRSAEGWLRDLFLLAALFSAPFFQYLGSLPLIDPDEGRYAEIPREMLERADLLTPTLNYVKYFEKPPLLYWFNAASIKLFGENEFAARFPSALTGLLTVLATYIIARRLYGRRSAILSAIILGTSIGFVMQSRIILTDMLLTFCLTASLGAFIIAAQREGRRSQELPWFLFYLFAAFATLTKGLIGIVFPAGIAFWYFLFSKRWNLMREMKLLPGILLFLAISVPWFVMVSIKNPEFARFFFIHEHFERFTSSVHRRYKPLWFFIPVLFATMLPWSFFIWGSIKRAWLNRHFEEGKAGLFLTLWVAVIFIFFSKSNSKLIPYILPIFPPLAILIASRFDELLEGNGREIKGCALFTGLVSLLLGVGFAAYTFLPGIVESLVTLIPLQSDELHRFITNLPPLSLFPSLLLGTLFLVQGGVAFIGAAYSPRLVLFGIAISSFFLSITIPRTILKPIAERKSLVGFATIIAKKNIPEARIISFGPVQGVNWYLKRRIMTAGDLNELTFGSGQGEQKEWFPSRSEIIQQWNSGSSTYLILKKEELQLLQGELSIPPQVIAESRGRLLVSNNR